MYPRIVYSRYYLPNKKTTIIHKFDFINLKYTKKGISVNKFYSNKEFRIKNLTIGLKGLKKSFFESEYDYNRSNTAYFVSFVRHPKALGDKVDTDNISSSVCKNIIDDLNDLINKLNCKLTSKSSHLDNKLFDFVDNLLPASRCLTRFTYCIDSGDDCIISNEQKPIVH